MKIVPLIGVLWGGSIVFHYFNRRHHENAAYEFGQAAAAVCGFLMFVAGLFYLMKGTQRAARSSSETTRPALPRSWIEEPLRSDNASAPIDQTPAEPVCPPGPTWAQLSLRLISATVISFCYLMLAIVMHDFVLPYYQVRTVYQPTKATVLEASVRHEGRSPNDSYCPAPSASLQGGRRRSRRMDRPHPHTHL